MPLTSFAGIPVQGRSIRILGIGGASNPGSSTESALRVALAGAQQAGAHIDLFDGADLLALPHYGSPAAAGSVEGKRLVDLLRRADGVILASPGYHGAVSGLLKNAIDYFEDTSRDGRVYLDGVPVGLIATAYGWQAAVGTLNMLRTITHSLRGWPTPLGAAVRTAGGLFVDGQCADAAVSQQLTTVGEQVVQFVAMRADSAQLRLGQAAI